MTPVRLLLLVSEGGLIFPQMALSLTVESTRL